MQRRRIRHGVRGDVDALGRDARPGACALTAQEFAALIRSEIAKWNKVIRAAGIQPE